MRVGEKLGVMSLLCLLIASLSISFVVAETVSPIDAWADSEHSSSYSAIKSFDGSTSTGWFSEYKPTYPVSLTLDFGSTKDFDSIEIYGYYYYLPIIFNLYASASNDSNGTLILSNASITEANQYNNFKFDSTSARYLRIEETTNANSHYGGAIYEVRANAEESDQAECSSDEDCESVRGEQYCKEGLLVTPIEMFDCKEGQCVLTGEIIEGEECDKGEMCQNGECVEASCTEDDDCLPTTTESYCDGNDGLHSSTMYFECLYGNCEEDYTDENYDYCYFGCENSTNEKNYSVNAKCIQPDELEVETCKDLLDRESSPESFSYEGDTWKLEYTDSREGNYYINQKEYEVEYLHNSYRYIPSDGENFEGYLEYRNSITEFEDNISQKDMSEIFEGYLQDGICELRMSYSQGVQRSYYVCSDSIYNFENNQNQNYKSLDIYWLSDNLLFSSAIYYYSWDYEKDELSTDDFLKDITDNKAFRERLEYSLYDFPEQVRNLIEKEQEVCQPAEYDEEDEACVPYWECIVQPVICPPHGEQEKKCVDLNGCYEDKTMQQSCNPGICAGCYIPKWFGYDNLEYQRCIPYGFRFESQDTSGSDIIEEGMENQSNQGYSLEIVDDYSAIFTFWDSDNEQMIHIYEGNTFQLPSWFGEDLEYLVEKIDESARTVEIKRKEEYNAYCDIDGVIKRQKTVQPNGDWATCQDNYECYSNFCSSGECIEVSSMLQEISGFKEMGVKVLCRFADIFSVQSYEQCIYENLGGSSPAMSMSNGAGGSSSS